jgi:hypothetical protein
MGTKADERRVREALSVGALQRTLNNVCTKLVSSRTRQRRFLILRQRSAARRSQESGPAETTFKRRKGSLTHKECGLLILLKTSTHFAINPFNLSSSSSLESLQTIFCHTFTHPQIEGPACLFQLIKSFTSVSKRIPNQCKLTKPRLQGNLTIGHCK